MAPPPMHSRPAPNASTHTLGTHNPRSPATKPKQQDLTQPIRKQKAPPTHSEAATKIQALFRDKAGRMRVAKKLTRTQATHDPLAHHDQEDRIGTSIKAVSKPHAPPAPEGSAHTPQPHSPSPTEIKPTIAQPLMHPALAAQQSPVLLHSQPALAGHTKPPQSAAEISHTREAWRKHLLTPLVRPTSESTLKVPPKPRPTWLGDEEEPLQR